LKDTREIFKGLTREPFSPGNFIREHKNGILGTIIFHLLILIALFAFKLQSAREIRDLDLVFDYTEPPPTPEELAALEKEAQKDAYFERLLKQQLQQSNQAANISEELDKKISTESFVDEVTKSLNEQRSEEYKAQMEEIEKMLKDAERVPVNEDFENKTEEKPFTGPTRISYEFIAPPFDRRSVHIPIPVYKCRGGGTVQVTVSVDRLGNVTSAKSLILEAGIDSDCLSEIALRFARQSRFSGSQLAPESHIAQITYQFVEQ